MPTPNTLDRRDSLLAGHPQKTLELGCQGTVASLSATGAFVGLFYPHPTRGQCLVAPFAQFPKDRFYDQQYVRDYRKKPLEYFGRRECSFGLSFGEEDAAVERSWSYINAAWPVAEWTHNDLQMRSTFVAPRPGYVLQEVDVINTGSATSLDLLFSANVSLNRASYTQLTPMGDQTIPPSENRVWTESSAFCLHNRHLPATMVATIYVDGERVELEIQPEQTVCDEVVKFASPHVLPIAPGRTLRIQLVLSLNAKTNALEQHLAAVPDLSDWVPAAITSRRGLQMDKLAEILGAAQDAETAQTLAFVIARNLDYLMQACSIKVRNEAGESQGTCVITENQCLPLGWHRDNYYQTRLLVHLLPHLDQCVLPDRVQQWRDNIHDLLKSHLVWQFKTARRPEGDWARCYLVDGTPRDRVFQLDQQCYPLLGLAEYAQLYCQPGSSASWQAEQAFVRDIAAGAVDDVLATLLEHRWAPTHDDEAGKTIWLFQTDETPADDPVDFPYHLSSHILLWHTLQGLAQLQEAIPSAFVTPAQKWADSVRGATMEHFSAINPDTRKPVFAYLTSTRGEYQFYHDANDLPTALAPVWGFVGSEDVRWRNTMDFAFTPANTGGFYAGGKYEGLGSVHSPYPWPLGDSQELIFAQLTGDAARSEKVRSRLANIVQWDGLYSEAIDKHSGVVTSKHWFGWPGTFIGSILLQAAPRQPAPARVDQALPKAALLMAQHVTEQTRKHQELHHGDSYVPPLVVGVQGCQGSGKTYLSTVCCQILSSHFGLRAETLSTDDLYLDFAGLQNLATRYPDNDMLQGRGLPGSHDVKLGKDLLQRIHDVGGRRKDGTQAVELELPVFDKSAYAGFGDRSARGRRVKGGFDVLLFEGWSQGFMPLGSDLPDYLQAARDRDALRYARRHSTESLVQIDTLLRQYVKDWYGGVQAFVRIVPPALSQVFKWRLQAEHAMKLKTKTGMTDEEVESFVARYCPAYELFMDGIESRSAHWSGKGLAICIDKNRDVTGTYHF